MWPRGKRRIVSVNASMCTLWCQCKEVGQSIGVMYGHLTRHQTVIPQSTRHYKRITHNPNDRPVQLRPAVCLFGHSVWTYIDWKTYVLTYDTCMQCISEWLSNIYANLKFHSFNRAHSPRSSIRIRMVIIKLMCSHRRRSTYKVYFTLH